MTNYQKRKEKNEDVYKRQSLYRMNNQNSRGIYVFAVKSLIPPEEWQFPLVKNEK